MPATFPVPATSFGVQYLKDLLDCAVDDAEVGDVLCFDAPYWFSRPPSAQADGGLFRRNLSTIFADRINAKDYMAGDGSNTPDQLTAFFAKVAAGYGGTANIPDTARLGYLPGGKYKGDYAGASGTTHSAGYAWSLKGDGPVTQLINSTLALDHLDCHIESLRLVGEGEPGLDDGIGLDIRAGSARIYDVNVYRKRVGISNIRGGVPGGTSSNLTLIGGWVRDCDIGVEIALPDYRAFGQRFSTRDVGVDFYDSGGIELVGCWMSATAGPSLLIRGHRVDFNASGVAGQFVLTNVVQVGGDFASIKPGDIVTGLKNIGVLLPRTRVVSVAGDGLSITIDQALLTSVTNEEFQVLEVPAESFFVGNTVGSGRDNLLKYDIVSIASANAGQSLLVTFTTEHELTYGMGRVTFEGTGVPFYDDDLNNRGWIEAVPSSTSVIVGMAYNGPVVTPATAKMRTPNDSAQFLTNGPSGSEIRSMFFAGGNHNGSRFKGGAGYNFIGTRLKTRRYMHGCRPFKADISTASKVLTNVTIPVSEIRVGTNIVYGTVLEPYTRVVSVDTVANTITIDKFPVANAVQGPIVSPEQPNNIFHVAVCDDQGPGAGSSQETSTTWDRTADVGFAGPGSLLGWSQIGMFPNGITRYEAMEGSYLTGARCPYTLGGLQNNQPKWLNQLGVMNRGVRMVSNEVQHDIQGSTWSIDSATLQLRGGNLDKSGTVRTTLGRNFELGLRAYRSDDGLTFGNSILSFHAPRSNTPNADTTADRGYIILPANSASTDASLFMGAATAGATKVGEAAAIRGNTSVVEVESTGAQSWWRSNERYARLTSGAGSQRSYVAMGTATSQGAFFGIAISTPDANLAVGTVSGTAHVNNMQTTLSNFERALIGNWAANVAQYGTVMGGTGVARDVSFLRGGVERIALNNGIKFSGLPTADPGVTGQLWIDTAAGRVLKVSA